MINRQNSQFDSIEYIALKEIYNGFEYKVIQITIAIHQVNKNYIAYTFEGQVLRIEEILSVTFQPKILKTLEQIKYLNWKFEYINQSKQIGKWMTIWKSNQIISSGYFEDKIKQGIWQEPIDNYWSKAQISYIGMYQNDQKRGFWKIMQENKQIGGGQYNEKGMKFGKWVEQSDDFWEESQVTYNGEYINGNKYGLWNTLYRKKFIGCGVYDQNGLKNGNWMDLIDGFCGGCQVIFKGKYKNGLKCGFWNSIYWQPWLEQFDYIGGGQYDVFGMKFGNWVELKQGYQSDRFVTLIGNYMDGKKYGRWDIKYRGIFIGGGNYYENEMKNGKWIEISDSFMMDSQVIYKGEYKNSQKFGKWSTMFRFLGEQSFINCGGGSYDEKGQKNGSWIDLSDNFSKFIQITFNGEYCNGKKVQKWKTLIINLKEEYNFKKIGGGLYNKDGMKNGKWVELLDNFFENKEITCNGKYNEGKKQGRWDYKKKGKEYIGGGLYNENGMKTGKWLDMGDYYKDYLQITWIGEYNNGQKCGKWDYMSRTDNKEAFLKRREVIYEIENKQQ